MPKDHEQLVASQFGPRARAYVESTVHAQGEDLEQLRRSFSNATDARVLDLGCGGGHASFAVTPLVRAVVAYDLSADMLSAVAAAAARRDLGNIETVCGDVRQLPFDDSSFDAVISRYSAHHWASLPASLKEARRVLKSDARAMFIDVVAPAAAGLDTFLQTIEMLRDPSHVRDYRPEEWERSLKAAGFAAGAMVRRKLRLDFESWIDRMRPPRTHVDAIRSLQSASSTEVVRYFEIAQDGSFGVDTLSIEATVC
jgi:SAM-dependent methyltransferase